jgi:hypothetical protein
LLVRVRWSCGTTFAHISAQDMDETALAVLARVSVVADKLKRGDFAN